MSIDEISQEPSTTAPVIMRLQGRDGAAWEAMAVDNETAHAEVVVFGARTFLYVATDQRVGRWLRIYREVKPVRIRDSVRVTIGTFEAIT